MKSKFIVYIDMDDTIADFIGSERLLLIGITPDSWPRQPHEMYEPGFFRELSPIDGALEAVRSLISNENLDVYILTKPVHDSPASYLEKSEWIRWHLPELSHKIIMTQQKELCHGHFLVDDSLHWKDKWESACGGTFIHFDPRRPRKEQWQNICKIINELVLRNS